MGTDHLTWTRRERGLLVIAAVSTALLVGVIANDSLNASALQPYKVTVDVSYQGGWNLTWVGYQDGPDRPTSGDNHVGFGNQSLTVITYGNPNRYDVSICAWAGKLDDSNRTLVLRVRSFPAALSVGEQQTTASFGIARVCGRVVP